jgi:hypothetical protein
VGVCVCVCVCDLFMERQSCHVYRRKNSLKIPKGSESVYIEEDTTMAKIKRTNNDLQNIKN